MANQPKIIEGRYAETYDDRLSNTEISGLKPSGVFKRTGNPKTDAEKLEEQKALNEALSRIIHDVNNLLACVSIEMSCGPLDWETETLIKERITNIQLLMQQSLSLNKLLATEKQVLSVVRTDIEKLIKQTLGGILYNFIIERRCELTYLYVDPLQFGRLVLNLCINALKFNGQNKEQVRIILDEDRDFHLISIKDSGVGLPDNSAHLFNLQAQVNALAEGGNFGLGLVVCKMVCDAHGAELEAKNNEDGPGATFTIKMPKNNE